MCHSLKGEAEESRPRLDNGVWAMDRGLLRHAWMSASTHPRSELLLASVVEAPRQLSPSQATDAQNERIEQRRETLAELGQDVREGTVGTRTRVVAAHDTSDVLRNAVEPEGVQHVVLGGEPEKGGFHSGLSGSPARRSSLSEVTAVRSAPYPPRTDEPLEQPDTFLLAGMDEALEQVAELANETAN